MVSPLSRLEFFDKMSDLDCVHPEFRADVKVGRITDGETGPVTNFVTELQITCVSCNTPFHFVGVSDRGLSFLKPTLNLLGTTPHAPIAPGESLPDRQPLVFSMQGAGVGGRQ